jgi:hypothetical protein
MGRDDDLEFSLQPQISAPQYVKWLKPKVVDALQQLAIGANDSRSASYENFAMNVRLIV